VNPNPYQSPREIEKIPAPQVNPRLDRMLALFCAMFFFLTAGTLLSALLNWLAGRPPK